MTSSQADQRSPERRALDKQIAAEPPLAPLEVPTDAAALPMEAHLGQPGRRPLAIAGIVENGLIRLVDPGVRLPEHSRVIIVATEAI